MIYVFLLIRPKMNKIDHVVYSGWLVKSPPEKKLSGPWKLFRARWKKRFFVLFKPASSLPGQYVLNYYRDEDCKKPKGCIDLEQCEQIIESLDSDNYPYLLAIKTFHRGKDRTYFLATQTEEQMSSWVRNLCSVCELKPDENPTDLPPTQKDGIKKTSAAPTSPISHVNHKQSTSAPVVKQPETDSYIPIADCHTGNTRKSPNAKDPIQRRESVDSVPEETAPPPPVKTGGFGEDDVFHPVTYDYPRSDADDIYKVPPRRVHGGVQSLEPYDIPPPTKQSPSTPRSSSSGSQKADSAYSSQHGLTYDIPPPRADIHSEDDNYDIPPPNPIQLTGIPDIPPARPLPTYYTNVPSLSKFHQGSPQNRVIPLQNTNTVLTEDDIYDLPKSHPEKCDASETNLRVVVPAPSSCGSITHGYVNAAPGIIAVEDEVYLHMDGLTTDVPHGCVVGTTNELDMYTTMNSDSNKQSVYDHPPRRTQAQPFNSHIHNSSQDPNDTYSIFSTARTRSFKRHNSASSNTDKNHNKPGNLGGPHRPVHRVELPKRLENQHPDMSTSSEDEDGDVLVNTSLNMWRSTPPAPKKQQEELKYIDLALDDSSDKEPVWTSHGHATGGSQTEYREIDFVKTKALSDVKKWKDVQRQQDDH